MTHNWMITSALTVALSAALAAQAPTQAQTPTQTPQTPAPSSSAATPSQPGAMTLTGCVQPGGTVPPAGSATPGAVGTAGTAAGTQYILTNARASLGTASAATSAAAATPAMTYALDGQAAQLKDHVGHQVEVSGQLGPASVGNDRDSGRPAAVRFDVQTVKMIAPSCNTGVR